MWRPIYKDGNGNKKVFEQNATFQHLQKNTFTILYHLPLESQHISGLFATVGVHNELQKHIAFERAPIIEDKVIRNNPVSKIRAPGKEFPKRNSSNAR